VEVVAEELCAAVSAVTIEDREELNLKLRLLVAVRLDARFLEIEHD